MGKAVISLTTGLEDAEKVTVALLVAVGAAESGRETLIFLTKEAVRLAVPGVGTAVACQGCPPLEDLMDRYHAAGGTYLVCPICVDAKGLTDTTLIGAATKGGHPPMWSGSATARRPSATDRHLPASDGSVTPVAMG